MPPRPAASPRRPTVLFFAEDVTLAHVGRMLALATTLDPRRYEVVVATGARYRSLAEKSGLRVVPLDTMGPEVFAEAIARGAPVYTRERLERYVEADLMLIAAHRPDLVVGDFRCSLGISAELARVPYFSVSNGVWSPATTLRFPVPELPLLRTLGVTLGSALVRLGAPFVFRAHLRAFNQVRRAVGLAPMASLQEAYTHGTRTLYTDLPELAPVSALPAGHEYLGPVLWEPAVPLPAWWRQVPTDKPIVYVNLGSSGDPRCHEAVLEGVAALPVTVLLATAGRELGPLPDNVFAAPYLPGLSCARRASVVVCNGGSGSLYQALAAGVPVLAVPSNADQHLCTGALVAQGAGRMLRAGTVTAAAVSAALGEVLRDAGFTARAEALQARVRATDAEARFVELVEETLRPAQVAAQALARAA